MAGGTVFDLIWAYPVEVERGNPREFPVQLSKGNVINRAAIKAVILYPALCTPETVWTGEEIELILALKKKLADAELAPFVNQQLKIGIGLTPEKRVPYAPLFQDASHNIRCQYLDTLDHYSLKIETGRFGGVVDKRAAELYTKGGFKHVYAVYVNSSVLNVGPPRDAIELGEKILQESYARNAFVGQDIRFNRPNGNARQEGDDQDCLIHNQVQVKKNADDVRKCQYGFEMTLDGRISHIDSKKAVVGYHPVFVMGNPRPCSIGHLSDVHLNARAQVLANSDARLIGHADFQDTIGQAVNIPSCNMKALLDKMADDSQIEVIVVTGDIVDYLENVFYDPMDQPLNRAEVRAKVRLHKPRRGSQYKTRYRPNVDLLTFYSLILDFYGKNPAKPVYFVSGNHDDYVEPVGIYPVLDTVKGFKSTSKTDDFIPASHNLTVSEAVMAFGEGYHCLVHRELEKLGLIPGVARDPASLAWVYTVLTPFRDFWVGLPEQRLIGLGWNDGENMCPPLPQSRAVSDLQLKLLRKAVDGDVRFRVLFTHFTFASYSYHIPEQDASKSTDPRWIAVSSAKRHLWSKDDKDLLDCGNFLLHRQEVFDLLEARKIQCILTGHSHRRAIYSLLSIQFPQGGKACPVQFYPMDTDVEREWDVDESEARPYDSANHVWIAVADSGGSLPRRNLRGEFGAYGMGECSAVRVALNENRKIANIGYLPAGRGLPRFAVAMDYYELNRGPGEHGSFLSSFQSQPKPRPQNLDDGIGLEFCLQSDWLDTYCDYVTIETIDLYAVDRELDPGNSQWHRIPLTRTATGWKAETNFGELRIAIRGILYMAIKFGRLNAESNPFDRYDFSSPWVFRATMKRVVLPEDIQGGRRTKFRLGIESKASAQRASLSALRKRIDKFDQLLQPAQPHQAHAG